MIINQLEKTLQLKMVYYGPAMSGKTTSLKALFDHFGKKDEVKSIESTVGRTLYFDYGVLSFQNEKWKLKINIYTTTGQDFYIVTRPTVLRAVDGIIFIVDSQKSAFKRNISSWNELTNYFDMDSFNRLGKVIVFNKQDLPDKFETAKYLDEIGYHNFKNIECRKSIAISSEGVLETFEDTLRLILQSIYHENLISNTV
ncbi:MAG: Small GTP-binding domain protein, Arf-domain signature [Promethearchaeota archaeon]|nr:MAG: Small GTP-binding domain protein, Arf-domain signature [Candidatus Lokiarchaeota archaeon]